MDRLQRNAKRRKVSSSVDTSTMASDLIQEDVTPLRSRVVKKLVAALLGKATISPPTASEAMQLATSIEEAGNTLHDPLKQAKK